MDYKYFSAKNHIFMAPIKTALATPQTGFITDEQIKYYERRAQGGVGTIILEPISVLKSGKEHPKQTMLDTDEHTVNLKKLIDTLHKYNTKLVVHLNHAGRAANPKASEQVLAPSEVKCPSTNITPKELTKTQIQEIISAFKETAIRAEKAGADAVEIQFGHGYIVNQFYSVRINNRTDSYGTDKFKFAKELLQSVKEAVKIPIFLRISGNEFIDGEETKNYLRTIIEIGEENDVSLIHIGWGNACDSAPWYYNHMSLPTDVMDKRIDEIKKMTELPVIAVGRMQKSDRYKKLYDDKIVDGVVFGRQLIIDPDFPDKILNSKKNILRCGSCLQGCLANVKSGKPIGCIANPELHKDIRLSKTGTGKRVAIIGGGPAGLYASLYLKKKDYDVTLFEKNNYLGGQWILAYKAPGKLSLKDTLDDIINDVNNNINVKLNFEVSEEFLQNNKFDIIIVATGAVPFVPPVTGLDNYITGFDFFSNSNIDGDKFLIIGGGLIGLEVAEKLINNNKKVTVVEMLENIGAGMEVVASKLFFKKYAPKIDIFTKTTVKQIENNNVIVKQDNKEVSLGKFDKIIVTAGTKPDNNLYESLKEKFNNVYLIGDAKNIGQIINATESALDTALKI